MTDALTGTTDDSAYYCHSTSCPSKARGPHLTVQRALVHEQLWHDGAQTCWTAADILASESAAISAAGPRGVQ